MFYPRYARAIDQNIIMSLSVLFVYVSNIQFMCIQFFCFVFVENN